MRGDAQPTLTGSRRIRLLLFNFFWWFFFSSSPAARMNKGSGSCQDR